MAIAVDQPPMPAVTERPATPATPASPASPATSWLALAGVASLGAAGIHAAAIGFHAEHRPAALAFAAVATLQLAWGALALASAGRAVAVAGVVVNATAVVGWAMAKTVGIGFVDGLDTAEAVQVADAVAAALALAAVLTAALTVASGLRPLRRGALPAVALGATGLMLVGMISGGTHVHADDAAGEAAHGDDAGGVAADDHAAPVVPPVPYDPAKPIDLGGVEGVSPEQQAAAENLVAVTILRLPKWSDPAVAEAAGFRTIGDGRTGHEHLVNQQYIDDGVILDPDRPESLVYDTTGGGRRLVAAMYMVQRGLPLEQVPDVGGKLMQWHTHENLCYNAAGRVAGLTNAAGECPPGLVKPVPTPMIHVWIEPHRCGPFAALEGIAGGRIPDGEAVLCDHAHGSKTSTT